MQSEMLQRCSRRSSRPGSCPRAPLSRYKQNDAAARYWAQALGSSNPLSLPDPSKLHVNALQFWGPQVRKASSQHSFTGLVSTGKNWVIILSTRVAESGAQAPRTIHLVAAELLAHGSESHGAQRTMAHGGNSLRATTARKLDANLWLSQRPRMVKNGLFAVPR